MIQIYSKDEHMYVFFYRVKKKNDAHSQTINTQYRTSAYVVD